MSLRLKSTGSASLTGQKIECECGASRTLSGITQASPDGQSTHLSSQLEIGQVYPCQGQRPWLGADGQHACGRPLRGSLRNAANVYYAQVRSSIYLPRGVNSAEHEIVALIEQPPLSTVFRTAQSFGAEPSQILQVMRRQQTLLVQPYSDAQLLAAISIVLQGGQQNKARGITRSKQETIAKPHFDGLNSIFFESRVASPFLRSGSHQWRPTPQTPPSTLHA